MATTKKDPKPFQCIDLLTMLEVGRYESELAARDANKGKPIDVYYRPRKRGF